MSARYNRARHGRTVLVIGGGGREHALCLALSESDSSKRFISPGNAGTQHYGTNHDVAASDIDGLIELSVRLGVDFVVVGPEAPCAMDL